MNDLPQLNRIGTTVVSWRRRSWKVRAQCEVCDGRRRHGITSPNDHEDPPRAFICYACWTTPNARWESENNPPSLS
jgi:hypothetical protein